MKIDNKKKDNPKLCQQLLSDGRYSLYLEYYIGRQEIPVVDEYGDPVLYDSGAMKGKPKYKIKHHRRKEVLHLYLMDKPRTPADRQTNKEILELANRIRYEREQSFMQDREGYRLRRDMSIDLYQYMEKYIAQYSKKNKSSFIGALKSFRKCIKESSYSLYKDSFPIDRLTADIVNEYIDFMRKSHKSGGIASYYAAFKQMISRAVDEKVILENPCKGISVRYDTSLKKDVLTPEEIQKLINTNYYGLNQETKKAFLFSLFCGLRFCDVKTLKYGNIDIPSKRLTIQQNKTEGRSSASIVVIPLSDSILNMIGSGKRDELVFKIPSYNGCHNQLLTWMRKAGIDKHITWHCARHSFALNILNNGANIKTIASLLGHSGLRNVGMYVRAIDKLKEDAINSLGDFEIPK